MIPTRTEEEIHQHEAWFRDYCRLNDNKKKAIAIWKKKKLEEHEENVAKIKEERERQNRVEIADRQKNDNACQLKKKSRINAWKMEKELQRAEKEEKSLREHLEKARREQIKINEQVIFLV